jgi:hypothetical protein
MKNRLVVVISAFLGYIPVQEQNPRIPGARS